MAGGDKPCKCQVHTHTLNDGILMIIYYFTKLYSLVLELYTYHLRVQVKLKAAAGIPSTPTHMQARRDEAGTNAGENRTLTRVDGAPQRRLEDGTRGRGPPC